MAILAPPADQPEADYRVTFLEPAADVPAFGGYPATPWWRQGVVLPGRVLAETRVQAPALMPERLALVRVQRLGPLHTACPGTASPQRGVRSTP